MMYKETPDLYHAMIKHSELIQKQEKILDGWFMRLYKRLFKKKLTKKYSYRLEIQLNTKHLRVNDSVLVCEIPMIIIYKKVNFYQLITTNWTDIEDLEKNIPPGLYVTLLGNTYAEI